MKDQANEPISCQLGKVFKLEPNIIILKVEDNITVDVPTSQEAINVFLKCYPGSPFYLIVDARKIHSDAHLDAMKLAATHKEFNQYCIAQAIITDNLAVRLLANFYAKTLKRNKNVRMVKNKNEALNWLKSNYENFQLDSKLPQLV